MKKKILVILSIVMVFALTLTGCGQKGSQDASAGNSEKESVVKNNDNPNEPSEGLSNEEAQDNPTSNIPNKDADGLYVYTLTYNGASLNIHTCVNVWDYIEDNSPYDTVDLDKMMTDLGWKPEGDLYGNGWYLPDGVSGLSIGCTTDVNYNTPDGAVRVASVDMIAYKSSARIQAKGFVSHSVSEKPYIIKSSSGKRVYMSFEQIVCYAKYIDWYRDHTEQAIEFPREWGGERIVP